MTCSYLDGTRVNLECLQTKAIRSFGSGHKAFVSRMWRTGDDGSGKAKHVFNPSSIETTTQPSGP